MPASNPRPGRLTRTPRRTPRNTAPVISSGDASPLTAAERQRLHEAEIKAAELNAAAREQERISSELHDGLGQHLTGIAFLAKAVANRLRSRAADETADVDQIVVLLNQAVANTRALARGLQPVGPEDNALSVALAQLALDVSKLYGVQCVFSADRPVPIANRAMAHHLYRIAQEAVNNAIKHGAPAHIEIELASGARALVLSIINDGHPVDEQVAHSGLGLQSMRYRARMLHAKLSLENVRGHRVRLRVVVGSNLAILQDGRLDDPKQTKGDGP